MTTQTDSKNWVSSKPVLDFFRPYEVFAYANLIAEKTLAEAYNLPLKTDGKGQQ